LSKILSAPAIIEHWQIVSTVGRGLELTYRLGHQALAFQVGPDRFQVVALASVLLSSLLEMFCAITLLVLVKQVFHLQI
jgi:hypothetical protein